MSYSNIASSRRGVASDKSSFEPRHILMTPHATDTPGPRSPAHATPTAPHRCLFGCTSRYHARYQRYTASHALAPDLKPILIIKDMQLYGIMSSQRCCSWGLCVPYNCFMRHCTLLLSQLGFGLEEKIHGTSSTQSMPARRKDNADEDDAHVEWSKTFPSASGDVAKRPSSHRRLCYGSYDSHGSDADAV